VLDIFQSGHAEQENIGYLTYLHLHDCNCENCT
jgi:hypothetical protein